MRLPRSYYELEKKPRLLGTLIILFAIPFTILLLFGTQELRKRAEESAGNATVSVVPPSVSAAPQTDFSVSVNVVQADGSISGFSLNFRFDPSVLEMTDINFGPLVNGAGCSNTLPLTPGGWSSQKDLAAINNNGGFDGYGLIAFGEGCNYRSTGSLLTMNFRAKAVGQSLLDITDIDLSDPEARGYVVTLNDGNVNVASSNRNPEITSLPVTTAVVGQEYVYDVEATDPDPGDTLTFRLYQSPSGMAIEPQSGRITWTPTSSQAGIHPVAVRVDDNRGGNTAQPFNITVSTAPPPQASTIYVDDQGSDYNGCGRRQGSPCQTIQKGVDEVVEGGTVYVGEGVYQLGFNASDPVRPTVLVSKRGLKIVGSRQNPGLTQIKRGSANFRGTPPLNQWFVLTIDGARDVLLEGFSLQGFDGVAVTGNASATLRHNFVIAQNVGVYNHQTASTNVTNNTIYGSNFGVEAWGQSRVGVYQNDIHLGSSGRMCIAKHDQAAITASGNNTGCGVTQFSSVLPFVSPVLAESPNTNYDPMFIDPQNGNLCLNPLSPLIDLGVTDVNGDGVDDVTAYRGNSPDVGGCEYQFCQVPGSNFDLVQDLNGDGAVTLSDLVLMVQAWRDRENYNPRLDFDNDGDTDLFDIVQVANHWAESCEP